MTERLQESNSGGRASTEERPEETTPVIPRHISRMKIKQVRFAEYSKRRTYVTDRDYEEGKSYSSADRKIFREEAAREGFRIRNLVSSCPGSTGSAFHLLLSKGLLSCEELLGIESLVSANPKLESQHRQSYSDLVLATQREMREKNDTVDSVMLAMVAIRSSSGRIEKARLRAALAL
ncbi:hypothetical protein ACHAW6_008502 [Cyclotella cf. meneghiniana]